MSSIQINHFYRLPIGQKFTHSVHPGTKVFVKSSKGGAHHDGAFYRVHPQKLVIIVEEKNWSQLDRHTTEFTEQQLADVIEAIIERAKGTYGGDRVDIDRLRKGLYCAHRTKPIRMIDLLHACAVDFPKDVLMGVYRNYEPATDTMRNGWTAQHAEPHTPSVWEILFGGDDDSDDEE